MSFEKPELSPKVFTPLDRHFAGLMMRHCASRSFEVGLAAALVSRLRREGNICIELPRWAGNYLPGEPEEPSALRCPPLNAWLSVLRQSSAVGEPGQFKPLILDGKSRLYLHRYWEYEAELAAAILMRANLPPHQLDSARLRNSLDRLFPRNPEINWQQVAAFLAARNHLCVISGGPGTGKTRTVVAILAMLLEQNPGCKTAVCAPTGKAAARLEESLKNTRESLSLEASIAELIPEKATTIHRLLGTIPDSPYFRHNEQQLLPLDVLVVDEASMVDLPLMAKLFRAVPAHARIILLGDKDQLASVEPGSVLGDICRTAQVNCYSIELSANFESLFGAALPVRRGATALADCLVQLQRNYRFAGGTGIYRLSQALNKGDLPQVLSVLESESADSVTMELNLGSPGQVRWKALPGSDQLPAFLRDPVCQYYLPVFQALGPREALEQFAKFRVLSPLRRGFHGIEQLNRHIENLLLELGAIRDCETWYQGRPVIITENNYHLSLFNGDIGMAWTDQASLELKVFFPGPNGLREFHPLRLPRHETVYAMTVHKSQGSEFDRVLLVLPDKDNPILTRELVYTGLTRAKEGVELWLEKEVFKKMVLQVIERSSGLRDALWGEGCSSLK